MKLKNLFITLGLTLAVGIGVGAGLSKKNELKSASAEGEWLFSAVLDLGVSNTEIPTYEGFDGSSIKFKCWNSSDYEGTVKLLDMHETGKTNVYMVIAKLESAYSFDRLQFRYTENSGDKYSEAYSSTTFTSGSTNKCVRGYNYLGGWTGDTWNLALQQYAAPTFDDGTYSHSFVADVANTRYKLTNINLVKDEYVNFYCDAVSNGYCSFFKDSCSSSFFSGIGTTWAQINANYTVDIFLENSYSDDGIIEMKAHSDPNVTYIYYVLENNTPTNDYIYTWGGSEQFGAWPGTKVTEAVGVQEVTNNGVLHFQGSETPKLIYKIPVDTAYPSGDDYFKLNNGKNENEEGYWASETRPINGHNAYWYTGAANSLAGYAIDWLVEAERIRNLATNTSVCHISVSDAESLVNTYLSLGGEMQETYIDCTTVYTHKRDKTEGNELVSYRAVVEELARIAGINLSPANKIAANGETSVKNTSALVLVIISATALVSVGGYFLLRKKREN